MYKTVRKGENSLQYTILPQTEEVLCNSGVKGKGRDYSPAIYVRRSGRSEKGMSMLTVACVVLATLVFIVAGIAITDFCVQKYLVPRAASQQRMNAIMTTIGVSRDDGVKSRKKELRVSEAPMAEIAGLDLPTASDSPVADSTERVKTSWAISGVRLFWRITVPPMAADEEESDDNIPSGPFSSLRSKNKGPATDAMIHPVVTTEPTTSTTTVASTTPPTTHVDLVTSTTPDIKTTIGQDVLISTKYDEIQPRPVSTANSKIETTNQNYPLGKDLKGLKDSILDSDDEDEFANWNTMPPMNKIPSKEMIAKMNEYYERELSGSVRKEEIPRMWPFGSSMTMFQWPDYSLEDSMIVPLLVGTAAMLTIALVLTAIVARRRRKALLAKAISQLEISDDVPADDNTTLLTVEQE